MSTQALELTARATCAKCPYFQNFGEASSRGWCSVFDQMARQHHQRTGTCDLEIEAVDEAQQATLEPVAQQQPVGIGGDATGCKLQPTQQAQTEFEQGEVHGRHDASQGWHPIYKEPATEYATGYLSGYNEILNPVAQQPKVSKPAEWSVCLDPRWGLYQAWVSARCIGHGSTYEEAERIAQKYVAFNEMIRRQNAAVLRTYAS